jgi:hypothetical protein
MTDEARIDVHRGVDHQAIQKATKLIDGPVVCTDNQDTTDAGRPSEGLVAVMNPTCAWAALHW